MEHEEIEEIEDHVHTVLKLEHEHVLEAEHVRELRQTHDHVTTTITIIQTQT